jgi:hypothetical protein
VRRAARLLVLLGAVAVGSFLVRSSAREVVLVYDLGDIRDATSLEVRIERGDDLVRRAEFPAPSRQVRHSVRLTDGAYHVRVAVSRPGGPARADREITVTESQTIVLPLAP